MKLKFTLMVGRSTVWNISRGKKNGEWVAQLSYDWCSPKNYGWQLELTPFKAQSLSAEYDQQRHLQLDEWAQIVRFMRKHNHEMEKIHETTAKKI